MLNQPRCTDRQRYLGVSSKNSYCVEDARAYRRGLRDGLDDACVFVAVCEGFCFAPVQVL
jgi:hypothetical protein